MTLASSPTPNVPTFLEGGGVMGEMLRSFDWSTNPLGPPDQWPQSLRVAVRLLLHSPQLMFIWWGPDLIQIYNDAYRETLGPDKHPGTLGAGGRAWFERARTNIAPHIDRVMSGQGSIWQRDQLVPIERNGLLEKVWWNYGFSPIDDASAPGGVGGVLLVCEDVTARHLAEQDFARVWHLSPILKVVGNRAGDISAVNPAWTAALGWSAEETCGHNVMEFVAPEDRDTGVAGMEQLAQGIPVIEYQNTFVTRTGARRRIAWTTVPHDDTLYAFGRDVTAEIESARTLQVTQEALRQSQKMEAVGQLTGGLAHDFNNLLAGIQGSLELIKRKLKPEVRAEVDRYIEAALSSGRRAASLTARLLAFGRRQSLDAKPTNLNALVEGMEDLLQRTLGETIVLSTRLRPDLWLALTDQHQFESALLNLSINARDAMPHGGTLTIETGHETLGEDYVRGFEGLASGDYVMLSVSDSGQGMTLDVLERAFEPFFTTKPLGQGTGLGLSMIYGFTKQANGHVRIDSTVGEGTTARLYMPRHTGLSDVQSDVAMAHAATQGAGERVLVIEDDPTIRMLIMETMVDLGYQAYEAEDGPSAMPRIDSAEPLDLMVTDVGLPGGMNGRQIAEIARQKRPGLKILFLTGYAEGAAVRGGFLEPGMMMLTKPFSLEILADTLRAMLAQP